ncbi:MAG: sugar phosphate isomerase/epimerase [Anaerolineae bacterium]|nr:sugar phosphate isomerase/epimerase [Anaerolineae bacterium]
MKPIALQLYTVRDALAQDWQGMLARIADIGYVGVETAGLDFAPSPAAAIAEFKRLGLQVTSAHVPLPTVDNIAELAQLARALGSDRIVLGGTGADEFGDVAAIAQRIAVFNTANAVAQAHGLRFGLHNHWWEFADVAGRPAFDVLLDDLDADIFLELDMYWIQTGGVDAAAYVARHAQRTPLLHVKDGPALLEADMMAVGSGVIDVPGVIAAAHSAEWLIVELDRCATDMLTAVADSYDYLVGSGLARGNK